MHCQEWRRSLTAWPWSSETTRAGPQVPVRSYPRCVSSCEDNVKLTSSNQGEEVWAFHEVAARWIIEEFGGAQKTTTRQPWDVRLRSEAFLLKINWKVQCTKYDVDQWVDVIWSELKYLYCHTIFSDLFIHKSFNWVSIPTLTGEFLHIKGVYLTWFNKSSRYHTYVYDNVDQDDQKGIGKVEQKPDLHRFDVVGLSERCRHREVDGGQNHHAGHIDSDYEVMLWVTG